MAGTGEGARQGSTSSRICSAQNPVTRIMVVRVGPGVVMMSSVLILSHAICNIASAAKLMFVNLTHLPIEIVRLVRVNASVGGEHMSLLHQVASDEVQNHHLTISNKSMKGMTGSATMIDLDRRNSSGANVMQSSMALTLLSLEYSRETSSLMCDTCNNFKRTGAIDRKHAKVAEK